MLTKDVSAELEAVITELHAQGKEPTVALVKARLSTSVPMPALITAIKSWKGSHRIPKVEVAAANSTSDAERIAQLEKEVSELKQRLTALEAKLS